MAIFCSPQHQTTLPRMSHKQPKRTSAIIGAAVFIPFREHVAWNVLCSTMYYSTLSTLMTSPLSSRSTEHAMLSVNRTQLPCSRRADKTSSRLRQAKGRSMFINRSSVPRSVFASQTAPQCSRIKAHTPHQSKVSDLDLKVSRRIR